MHNLLLIPQQLTLHNMSLSLEQLKEKKRCLRALEALLFAAPNPLSLETLHRLLASHFDFSSKMILSFIDELALSYVDDKRGFMLEATKEGFRLVSDSEFAPLISQMRQGRSREKLSPQALEVLALVAFKGPLSSQEIEGIRGADSSYTLQNLEERGLIEKKENGEKRRKFLWSPTPRLFTDLGIKHINDLITNA